MEKGTDRGPAHPPTTDPPGQAPNGPPQEVTITIDGREFTVDQGEYTAAELLGLAGLDPEGYDLAELHGNRPEPKRYADADTVRVQPGDRFVTIRDRAAVA